jgi:hypothetical protein
MWRMQPRVSNLMLLGKHHQTPAVIVIRQYCKSSITIYHALSSINVISLKIILTHTYMCQPRMLIAVLPDC